MHIEACTSDAAVSLIGADIAKQLCGRAHGDISRYQMAVL